jgi:hypothetical protein
LWNVQCNLSAPSVCSPFCLCFLVFRVSDCGNDEMATTEFKPKDEDLTHVPVLRDSWLRPFLEDDQLSAGVGQVFANKTPKTLTAAALEGLLKRVLEGGKGRVYIGRLCGTGLHVTYFEYVAIRHLMVGTDLTGTKASVLLNGRLPLEHTLSATPSAWVGENGLLLKAVVLWIEPVVSVGGMSLLQQAAMQQLDTRCPMDMIEDRLGDGSDDSFFADTFMSLVGVKPGRENKAETALGGKIRKKYLAVLAHIRILDKAGNEWRVTKSATYVGLRMSGWVDLLVSCLEFHHLVKNPSKTFNFMEVRDAFHALTPVCASTQYWSLYEKEREKLQREK